MLLLFGEASGVAQMSSFDSFPWFEDNVIPSKVDVIWHKIA